MNTRLAVTVSGAALLGVGWAIGGQWAALGAAAGLACLLALLALPGWAAGPVLVAGAFVAEVAVAARANWTLVVLGGALLSCFLAASEVHGGRLGGGWAAMLRPHAVPVLAAVVAGVIVAAVSTLSIGSSALVALVAVGGAACVVLLLLAGSRS
jgi:hypothetical protein